MARPKYLRLADDLRRKIKAGYWAPGDQIPTEPELERESTFSRNTVREAIQQLVREGLLDRRQGEGTFVRRPTELIEAEPGDPSPTPGEDVFRHTVKSQDREPDQEFRFRLEPAEPEVAAKLKVASGAMVVVRGVDRIVDGDPWSRQESFYDYELVRDTLVAKPADIPHGTTRELARHGHEQVGYRDTIICRMPTPDEIVFLGPGPVMEVSRVAYSTERPIRFTVSVYATHTFLRYEVGDVPID